MRSTILQPTLVPTSLGPIWVKFSPNGRDLLAYTTPNDPPIKFKDTALSIHITYRIIGRSLRQGLIQALSHPTRTPIPGPVGQQAADMLLPSLSQWMQAQPRERTAAS